MKKLMLFIVIILISIPFIQAQEKNSDAKILEQLDIEFDNATSKRGVDGWVVFFAPNGSMVDDTSRPVTGPDEIRKAMELVFRDSTFSLRWRPIKAEILIPGKLGYTTGKYVRLKTVLNKKMKWTGTYSTLWMKQPDGTWKVVFDTGESDRPPAEVK
jgi:ketosteroid isomerase-like protein